MRFCISGIWRTVSAWLKWRIWWWWAASRTPCACSPTCSPSTATCVASSKASGLDTGRHCGATHLPRGTMTLPGERLLVWAPCCSVAFDHKPLTPCYWLKVPPSWAPTAIFTVKGLKEKGKFPEQEKLVLSNNLPLENACLCRLWNGKL